MIIVCSLSDHKHVCNSVEADHLISVIDPGYEPKTPTNIKYHLKLGFDDIIEINETISSNPKLNINGITTLMNNDNKTISSNFV